MVFEEFVVPEPLVTGALVVAALTIAALLYALQLQVSQRTVLAFVPWMVSGALLHVLYQMETSLETTVVPEQVVVVLSAPSVYVTTFIFMGVFWILAAMADPRRTDRVAWVLAVIGILAATAVLSYTGWVAFDQLALAPVLPLFGLLGSLALTVLLYLSLGLWRPYIIAKAQYVGALVLFAHIFDGIITAIGIDALDVSERSTVPQLLLDVAADLPTSDLIGDAWLFVVVKILVATIIVVSFHDYVQERPTEGNLFFALIAAVGLGPATHNFFLFVFAV